jgi:hypothetical protein
MLIVIEKKAKEMKATSLKQFHFIAEVMLLSSRGTKERWNGGTEI